MERSSTRQEFSSKNKERASMSPADDVVEMQGIANELADRLVGIGAQLQQRVGAVLKVFTVERVALITDNRALEFIKGKARRVDAWEKEHAARQLEKLRRDEAVNHVANLNRTLAYLREVDPDGYGAHIAAMEHTLAEAGVLARTVAPASYAQPEEGR
jgi:hypothetical protein